MPEPTTWLRDRLKEGDRRVPGAAAAIADAILGDPDLTGALVELLDDRDSVVVSHAAHAAMQVSAANPALFDTHLSRLIALLEGMKQWELGEQLPKIIVRCHLPASQARQIRDILFANLQSEFNIVAACSLQAIVDLALDGCIERADGERAVEQALRSPRKALSARARKLQKQLAGAVVR